MIEIEKRKFITELSRLLTFMYDEDRNTAIQMYEEMFDSCSDPADLIKFLASPTRQAVLIARKYNAKERDLAVRSKSGDGEADIDAEENPSFVEEIENIMQKAADSGILYSFGNAFSSDETAEDSETRETADEVNEGSVSESPADEAGTAAEPKDDADTAAEPVDELPPEEVPHEEPSEVPAAETAPVEDTSPAEESAYDTYVKAARSARSSSDQKQLSGEINVFLLILYIIAAVPFTAAAIIIILIPAVLFLAISAVLTVIGIQVISTAFGGFAVFADIMVVLGAALVIIALGILALWIFIWFIGGAIVGVINYAIRLGGKICISGGDEE